MLTGVVVSASSRLYVVLSLYVVIDHYYLQVYESSQKNPTNFQTSGLTSLRLWLIIGMFCRSPRRFSPWATKQGYLQLRSFDVVQKYRFFQGNQLFIQNLSTSSDILKKLSE